MEQDLRGELQVFLLLTIYAVAGIVHNHKIVRTIVLLHKGTEVTIELMLRLLRYIKLDDLGGVIEALSE